MQAQQQASESSLSTHIGRIAGTICNDRFPTGDRAMLRRMTPGAAPPLRFYRFALDVGFPGNWEHQVADWMTIVAGIALMSPNAHRPDVGFGKALAESRFSESRLERLLASEHMTRRTLLLRAVRFLAGKNAPMNWNQAAQLLLTKDVMVREQVHRRIARDFYQNVREKSEDKE